VNRVDPGCKFDTNRKFVNGLDRLVSNGIENFGRRRDRHAACYLKSASAVRYYGKGAVIVLGSRAAGKRASRLRGALFFFPPDIFPPR
jgi:hypothetical protein